MLMAGKLIWLCWRLSFSRIFGAPQLGCSLLSCTVGNKQRSEWIFQLVFRARNRELVMVPIMFLPQGHNGLTEDQCRVLSVYPFDTERVRSHMQQGKLSPAYRTRYRLGDLRPPP